MSNSNASVYLVIVGLDTRLGRAASIGQGVAVGVGTCNGSQVLSVAQEGMRNILN